jgi:hypothetical protein
MNPRLRAPPPQPLATMAPTTPPGKIRRLLLLLCVCLATPKLKELPFAVLLRMFNFTGSTQTSSLTPPPPPSYLWPTDGPDSSSLRRRVAASITCLFAAKCCNVIVPLSFKEVIDSFGGNPAAVAGVALPVALLAAYASSRLMAGLFSELRSALFARVSQNAVRSVSTRLFNHVQHLDLECVVCWPRCRAAAANLTQPEGIT